jgi:hypothetical protein
MWPKVIFWLLIIIIGFGYIRSLAKRPGAESEPPVPTQTAVTETEPAGTAEQPAATAPSEGEAVTKDDQAPESTRAVDTKPESRAEKTISVVEPATPTPAKQAAVDTEQAVAAKPIADQEATPPMAETTQAASPTEAAEPPPSEPEAVPETAPEPGGAPTTASQTPADAEAPVAGDTAPRPVEPAETGQESRQAARTGIVPRDRQERAESVSEILQEFDTMRQAAEAERQAMRELMEKERVQRWPSMPRYPAYPGWQERGYQQQSYPPAYNPYGYGYPQ